MLACTFLFVHCVKSPLLEISSGTTDEIYHKMYFVRIFAPQNEIATFSCFFVIAVVDRSFLQLYQVSYLFFKQFDSEVFACFFRIPTGTQKNFLLLSSREHGKASGGPLFL